MPNFLDELIARQKRGEPAGIASVCSAHPWVLKTALRHTLAADRPLLIESTCNQVNQDGGYTGMTPADFSAYVQQLRAEHGVPPELLHLGGDHLGPSPWQSLPAAAALEKADALVAAYAQAGFTKLHLDASMTLADDPPGALAPETAARRTARLALAAENAASPHRRAELRYVIGAEVPVPGGALEFEADVEVTPVARARETLDLTHQAFHALALEGAWERVIALVVQPGVEFGDDFVLDYQPARAAELARFIETLPSLVFEVHSTDYQTPEALSQLKRDHFAILKVGPGLTFAFREAVFTLAYMEDELFGAAERSNLVRVLDAQMLRNPEHWNRYYTGDEQTLRFKRLLSFSDRSRYYWAQPEVQNALTRLLDNFNQRPLPLALVSQYDPAFYARLRQGSVQNRPAELIHQRIRQALGAYSDPV